MRATRSAPGEGEMFWFLGTLAIVRVPPAAVGGRYSLTEFLFPHHASPPLHTHPEDETFMVLDGRIAILADGDRFEAGPGDIAVFPAGCAHTFRVDSETARALVLSTPAGIEEMLRRAGVPAAAATLPPPGTPRPEPDAVAGTFAALGQENLGPPLGPED
jgi:quercetin dioxygenase-like cupin family protein